MLHPCHLIFLGQGFKETALHLAVRLEEKSSLALVDFLCQNRSDNLTGFSNSSVCSSETLFALLQQSLTLVACAMCFLSSNCLDKCTAEGNTALHYSALYHKPESLKLLLKAKAALNTGTLYSEGCVSVPHSATSQTVPSVS